MVSRELLNQLSKERDKYSLLAYELSQALKLIAVDNNKAEERQFNDKEEIIKFVQEVLNKNHILY